MNEDAPEKKCDAGAPAWITTFADLAILLMCFFVLLLAFSEMDAQKYKQLAGSMKQAFGVQREVKVKEPPKGVNIIAREFSPGKPEPTSLNEVRQKTTNDMRMNLKIPGQEVSNEFLKKGIQLCVDGHEPDFVRNMLNKDINLTIERHDVGQGIFKSIGDVAPAMGMIGTLVGLVQMLASMDDPKMIGPAMAVALLTTLYGAIIANAFALPIADKLAHRSKEERCNKKLILETVGAIQQGLNPRVMEELLKTYLPGNQREDKGKEAA